MNTFLHNAHSYICVCIPMHTYTHIHVYIHTWKYTYVRPYMWVSESKLWVKFLGRLASLAIMRRGTGYEKEKL